jgi:hypothetical protein
MSFSSKNLCATLLLLASAAHADITGAIKLKGTPPVIPHMTPRFDSEVCGQPPRALSSLKLGAHQTVSEAIIYLSAPAPTGTKGEILTLEVQDCTLSPRIQVTKAISAVMFKNHDPILHVVRFDLLRGTNAPKTLATVAAPYAGFEKQIPVPALKEPAILRVSGLNGHEWLTAYIAVLPFQWATLSDTNGQFTIPNVRPGSYKIFAWHETLGTLASEVKVGSNRTARVDLEFTTVPPQAPD